MSRDQNINLSCNKLKHCLKSNQQKMIAHPQIDKENRRHDFYVRAVITINNIQSNIRYDLNIIMKELGVWINSEERSVCQGLNLNADQYKALKQTLRQMKHDYENISEEQSFIDLDRCVKSHYSAAFISDDGYPLVTQYGVSGDSKLIRILASFTLSYKERGNIL